MGAVVTKLDDWNYFTKFVLYPIGSMYGIYANIWGILMGSMLPYIAYMDPMGMRWPHTTFTSGASRSFDATAFFMWGLHVLGQTIADNTEYVVPCGPVKDITGHWPTRIELADQDRNLEQYP